MSVSIASSKYNVSALINNKIQFGVFFKQIERKNEDNIKKTFQEKYWRIN